MKTLFLFIIIFPLAVMANVDVQVVLVSNHANGGSTGTMVLEMQAKSNAGNVEIGQFKVTFLDDNVLHGLNPSGVFSDQLFTSINYDINQEYFTIGAQTDEVRAQYTLHTTGSPTPEIISGSEWTKIYTISITYNLSSGQTTSFSWKTTGNSFVIQQTNPYADITGNLGALPSNVSLNPPLPVELIKFTADLIDEKVNLNWETATEVNNYGFDIERKLDGEVWNKVAFVPGNGNSNSPKYYCYTDKSVNVSGKYLYRLKQIDNGGTFSYSNIVEVHLNPVSSFELAQNYPNPFNPTTKISWQSPVGGWQTIKVYNILGNEITILVDEYKPAGSYEVEFNAAGLTSGVYFYTLTAGTFNNCRKMVVIK